MNVLIERLARQLEELAQEHDRSFAELAEQLREAASNRKPADVQSTLERMMRRAGSIGVTAIVGQLARQGFDILMTMLGAH